jgi:hypothetical protein
MCLIYHTHEEMIKYTNKCMYIYVYMYIYGPCLRVLIFCLCLTQYMFTRLYPCPKHVISPLRLCYHTHTHTHIYTNIHTHNHTHTHTHIFQQCINAFHAVLSTLLSFMVIFSIHCLFLQMQLYCLEANYITAHIVIN